MSKQMTLTVEVTDEEAETLEQYDDGRLAEVMKEGLEELASAEAKREELRSRRPEHGLDDTEELSDEALEQAMREYLRGERKNDPRLD